MNANWVLVKHYHDSGAIEGVFGPYTQEQAEWLRTYIGDGGINAWTVVEMKTMPSGGG